MTLPVLTAEALSRLACDFLTVDVGKFSYGEPIVRCETIDYAHRTLKIGNYCSVADGVQIFVGRHGRHGTNSLTTYPLRMLVSDQVRDEMDATYPPVMEYDQDHLNRPLDVLIGNDVWIGMDVIIMAGVTIGNGAVIGAKAVVTRDVAPFAIMAGNPAREVRKRHNPEIVHRLEETRWWLREPDDLYGVLGGLLYSADMEAVLRCLERHIAQAS